MSTTHPIDSIGNAIHQGDRVMLPWGLGVILEVGCPRSTIKYDSSAGGEVLGASNRLVKVMEARQ